MIYLITGVPGAGKTLRAIYHILRLQKENRTVYADIDGLDIPGVLPGVEDWRETPDGSVVVYDECQQRFGPDKGQGRSDNPVIAAFEVHRHTGHDIILITQHPGLLHSHVRRLVGRHEHLTRAYGWGRAMVYGRDQLIDRFTPGALNQCEVQLWKHPAGYYRLYHSASEHTHKRRIPFKLAAAALVVVVGGSIVGYKLLQVDPTDITGMRKNLHAQQQGYMPGEPVRSLQVPGPVPRGPVYRVAETVGGCIMSVRACRCFSGDMLPLALDDLACRELASKPLPFSARIGTGAHRGERAAAPTGAVPSPDVAQGRRVDL